MKVSCTWRRRKALHHKTLISSSTSCSSCHKYVQVGRHTTAPPHQAAPLLKETLNDINWKDLEALRKVDAGT